MINKSTDEVKSYLQEHPIKCKEICYADGKWMAIVFLTHIEPLVSLFYLLFTRL